MSLQVWLPLNGDLNQQGISTSTVAVSTATIDNNGKIGKCYSFTEGQYIGIDANNINNHKYSPLSIAMWVYPTKSDSSERYLISCYEGGGAGIHLQNSKLDFTVYVSGYKHCISQTITLNAWHHVCGVYDGVNSYIYIDGELHNTLTVNGTITYHTTCPWEIGGNPGGASWASGAFVGKINDVRIYDNALSEKEIKEIAKGLVLHYPLNDKYIESTTNISTTVTAGTGSSGWGGHSATRSNYNATDDPVPFDQGTKIDITYSSGGGGFGCILDRKAVNASTTYTFSLYIKASDNFTYTHANFLYHYEYSSSGTTIKEFGVFDKSRMEYMGNGWYRIWGSFTTNAETATTSIYFFSYPGTNMTYWIGGWQLEQKDHITPFVTPGTSRNNSIVYDCSGYCNNGIRTGTFNWTSDAPKYNVSTNFSGDERIEANSLPSETKTIACWVNFSEVPSGYTIPFFDKNSKLAIGVSGNARLITYIGTAAGGTGTQINTSFNTNKWYHIVVVKTGDDTRSVYINGELKPSGGGNWWGGDLDKLLIGCRHASGNYQAYFKGQLCDIRAYATALSEKDILSLYNNNAYIDSDGKIYGKIR